MTVLGPPPEGAPAGYPTVTVHYTAACPCCGRDALWTGQNIIAAGGGERTVVTVACPGERRRPPWGWW